MEPAAVAGTVDATFREVLERYPQVPLLHLPPSSHTTTRLPSPSTSSTLLSPSTFSTPSRPKQHSARSAWGDGHRCRVDDSPFLSVQYGPHALSREPWIVMFDTFLTHEEADHLLFRVKSPNP